MNLVQKISMIILMESDLEAAVNFYTKLGLKPVFHLKNKWAEFELDGVQVGLCPIDQKYDNFRTGIVFQIADLNDFYAQRQADFSFIDKPVEAVHGIMASIKDPGGNIIDLYQPTPEKVAAYAEQMKKEGRTCKNDDSKQCCSADSKQKSVESSDSSCCA
jgi:catechol 2,3-dioxygenase-like lactoylglutathione lyase family enzyme